MADAMEVVVAAVEGGDSNKDDAARLSLPLPSPSLSPPPFDKKEKMDKAEVGSDSDDVDDETSSTSSSDTDTPLGADDLDEMMGHDDDEAAKKLGPPRTKNEITEEPYVPVGNEAIKSEDQLIVIGTITSLHLDLGVAVAIALPAVAGKEIMPVNDGSVVCTATRDVVGRVDEVFGPVSRPYYKIRLEKTDDISGVSVDTTIYAVEKLSTLVNKHALESIKATDASNEFNEELPIEEQDFSDDEEERRARSKKKGGASSSRQRKGRNRKSRRGRARLPAARSQPQPQPQPITMLPPPVFPNPFASGPPGVPHGSTAPPSWLGLPSAAGVPMTSSPAMAVPSETGMSNAAPGTEPGSNSFFPNLPRYR